MNNHSINIAKKKIEKGIIEELYKKEIIDFFLFNKIINKINSDIDKIGNNISKIDDINNIVVKIPI